MPPGKRGESPNSDRHGATWFISPWRSDGAFRDETLPRVKSVLAQSTMRVNAAQNRLRRATSPNGGRNADGDAVTAERILPNLPASLRPGRSRDHAPPEKTKGIMDTHNPRLHRRSRMTMKQTHANRKRVVLRHHELATINIDDVNLYPIC